MRKIIKYVAWMIVLFIGLTVQKVGLISTAGSEGFIKHGISKTANAAEVPSFEFAWFPNKPGIKRAQIMLGTSTTLKFEFTLKAQPTVTQVRFVVPKKYAGMGVMISPGEVAVTNGKAVSKAIFACPPGTPLGKFDMLVIAVDAKTGREIGRGITPFMLLPAGVGGC